METQFTTNDLNVKFNCLFTESKHLCSFFEEILVSLRTKLVQG